MELIFSFLQRKDHERTDGASLRLSVSFCEHGQDRSQAFYIDEGDRLDLDFEITLS